MYGVIYKVINNINGKMYIGQTRDFKRRKTNHIGHSSKSTYAFHKAIDKYGRDNFTWEIIDEADTIEELIEKEKYWIEHYNTYIGYKNANGYNMTKGGDEAGFYVLTPVVQLDTEGNFIAEFDSIAEAGRITGIEQSNISTCCRHIYDISGNYLWVYKSEYDPNKEYTYINKVLTPIVQLDLKGNFINRFNGIREAQRILNIKSIAGIIDCCNGRKKSSYGYLWVYANEYDEDKEYKYEKGTSDKWRKVVQLDLDDNFINEYCSMNYAAFQVNGKSSGIRRVCEKQRNLHRGYKWMYADEYYSQQKQETV